VTGDEKRGGFRCGTCAGEPAPPGTKTAREWDAEYAARTYRKPSLGDRIVNWLVCGECFRLRFSPGHWLTLWAHDRSEVSR
jgi:hypothetical protein